MLSDDPSAWYRMSGVLNYINHPELRFVDITQDKVYSWETLSHCSTLILQRPTADAHISLIKLAKDMNIRIICDWDDDLFSVHVHRNANINYEDMKRNVKMTLHLSDEVWVTTPALKKIYKPFNRNIHIIPNSHNDYLFPISGKMSFRKGKLITYRGGASHQLDVQENIHDLWKTISENQKWEFRFVGAGMLKNPDNPSEGYKTMFELLDERTVGLKNHTFTLPNSLIQFFKVYQEFNAQIAFFPLVTHAFNQAKSNISLLEATYAGSCYLGNRNLKEFDYPFVTDISDGLYEPFNELKNDYPRMKRLNYMAWEWLISERLLSNINKLRIERLLL